MAKRRLGFIPDRPFVYEKLTGAEFLAFAAGLYHVTDTTMGQRREHLLAVFDLDAWRDELIESYSHGMKQRLVMAAALIHAPRILIVDEPMVGMDPQGALALRRLLMALAAGGVTIFLSTHSLGVAEELCDRIAILDRGRLVAIGSLAELRARASARPEIEARDGCLEALFLRLTAPLEAGGEP